jgi:hypothetical protein
MGPSQYLEEMQELSHWQEIATCIHCKLHRQAPAFCRYMSEELKIVFQAVIRVVNYSKNSPSIGRNFGKLCEVVEAEHTVRLYYCGTRWLPRAVVFCK